MAENSCQSTGVSCPPSKPISLILPAFSLLSSALIKASAIAATVLASSHHHWHLLLLTAVSCPLLKSVSLLLSTFSLLSSVLVPAVPRYPPRPFTLAATSSHRHYHLLLLLPLPSSLPLFLSRVGTKTYRVLVQQSILITYWSCHWPLLAPDQDFEPCHHRLLLKHSSKFKILF